MWKNVQEMVESVVVPVLKPALDPAFEWLNGLPPWSWKLAVCIWLTAGVLWGLFLPRPFIYAGAPTGSRWRDLRIWLVLLLIPYLAVYLFF